MKFTRDLNEVRIRSALGFEAPDIHALREQALGACLCAISDDCSDEVARHLVRAYVEARNDEIEPALELVDGWGPYHEAYGRTLAALRGTEFDPSEDTGALWSEGIGLVPRTLAIEVGQLDACRDFRVGQALRREAVAIANARVEVVS